MIFRIKVFAVPAGRKEELSANASRTRLFWELDGVERSDTGECCLRVFLQLLSPASVSKCVSLRAPWNGRVCALRRVAYVEAESLYVWLNRTREQYDTDTYLGECADPGARLSQWLLEVVNSHSSIVCTGVRKIS